MISFAKRGGECLREKGGLFSGKKKQHARREEEQFHPSTEGKNLKKPPKRKVEKGEFSEKKEDNFSMENAAPYLGSRLKRKET